MNLEREKITEEVDKRAQMRRNLDNILSRGPKSPTELQMQPNYRSNPKWQSDEEDTVLERRAEMPRIRNDNRDQRNFRDPRDIRDDRDFRLPRETRDFRDARLARDPRDYRDMRNSREVKEPLDMRDLKDVPPMRDARDYRDYRDGDVRNYNEHKDPKMQRSVRDDYKEREFRDPIDVRDIREVRNIREARDMRDVRDVRDVRDIRDVRDVREYKEKDAKYLREYNEVDDFRNKRNSNDDMRHSRERTPQLEQRYFEYKGERNDKYFDNRYKQDSRSDDEGVESEKQFEEIRYVPHVEMPRRRDPDPRMNKIEPVKKDGRIELLEERQRQMEAKARAIRPVDVEDRYDRSLEVQKRPYANNRDWEVLRRSYAEAERPRRDGRARHSYAEPVPRTRVGMATVAPF